MIKLFSSQKNIINDWTLFNIFLKLFIPSAIRNWSNLITSVYNLMSGLEIREFCVGSI
jgi:hypothetical protein